ncbi:signal peptidase I [Sphingomonas parva]|uniref:Signal peptidase I n=1 Tax=Sphingomonas parva TaxID=2555898 RepID=A0A4Y8ZR44_9SPHN|nr:signal peptidase I [Sphingomonas parva]TFI57299.1 signal peptidase I [Sphingomonas parva]
MATTKAPPKKAKGGLAETTRFLLLLFLFALILRSFVVAPFVIPSGSMLPRLMIGDYLFVAKWPYGFSRYSMPFGLGGFDGRVLGQEPERGDVVVFRYPSSDEDYVKRLIGLPGDRVQMRGGQLVLNGRAVPKVRIADYLMPRTPNSPCRYVAPEAALPPVVENGETFCRYARYRETLPGGRSYEVLDQWTGEGDDTPVITIPEDHYFMMGDNRDDSADSRYPLDRDGVGFLHRDRLIGRALIVFFSTDGSASWTRPWTWFSAARLERVGRTF